MRLPLLTLAAMIAFAANSVLTRVAVTRFDIAPGQFAVIRVAAGAAMLLALVAWRGGLRPGWPTRRRIAAAAALAIYMGGFSLAYLTLDTGAGALILFGGVQITMFTAALLGGEAVPRRRIAGAGLALSGLAVLVWPGAQAALPPGGVALMAAAALGWGIYSLLGRSEADPVAATSANFVLCLPMVMPLWIGSGPLPGVPALGLAVLSGAVTSGLGYALWYGIVPALGTTRAAVAQLSVPVIAALGGVALLGEGLGWRFAVAAALVTAGIGLSLVRRRL